MNISFANDTVKQNQDLILERYKQLISKKNISQKEIDLAFKYAHSINQTGSWDDIVYNDRDKGGWDPGKHLKRIQTMCRVINHTGLTPAQKQELGNTINAAIMNWGKKRYHCTNWWWNEIGVPRIMREIIILAGDNLASATRKQAIDIMGQLKVRGIGANLMWSAELSIHHGCLTGNQEQITSSINRIWDHIQVGQAEGIQQDWSFHQHGARLQTFHYGFAYIDVVNQIAWQLRGTQWEIPKAKKQIISNYILNGVQWMFRGGYTVPSTMDRQATRKGRLTSKSLPKLLRFWQEVDPEHVQEYNNIIKSIKDNQPVDSGYRHFPESDFTVYHHPKASFFLKTISNRTRFSESINTENLKGVPYFNCGDQYILKEGPEYFDLPAVWDWKHLPGLTTAKRKTRQKRQTFVGGLGRENHGITTMSYVRAGANKTQISTRKTWFFFNDTIICLMSNWQNNGKPENITTSLEQCRLNGKVQICRDQNEITGLQPGKHEFNNLNWLLHNDIGYIPLNMSSVKISAGNQTGSWYAINNSYSKDIVTEPVLKILLKHGKVSDNQGWIVMLDADAEKLNKQVKSPDWEIIESAANCQAINFAGSMTMAAFFQPGTTGNLTVDKPCLAIWNNEELLLADPTMKGGKTAITWNNKEYKLSLPANGKSISIYP